MSAQSKLSSLPPGDVSVLAATLNERTVKVLAASIFRHLQREGCQAKDIITVSSQLLSLITNELRNQAAQDPQK